MDKTCKCCDTHYTSTEDLEFIGESEVGKFYNCPCGSTLVIINKDAQ